jgi:CheY-specific phosphatase CheX
MEPAAVESDDARELTLVVLDAARHVLTSYGLSVSDPTAPCEGLDPAQIAAVIGFNGETLRGTMAIIAPPDLIRCTCPPLQATPEVDEGEIFDWAGELLNMMLGRVKVGLSARGVDIDSSTPRVMMASQLKVRRAAEQTVCSACLGVGLSRLTLWFDAVACEAHLFAREPEPDCMLPAGEVALFD